MAEEETAAVALCADLNIEVGVHVTLYSLLENAGCHVRIYFIHKGYTSTDFERLRSSLAPFDGRYELRPIRADDAQFRRFKSTRGDHFTYVRLLLPDLIDESRLLYLDCDLVVGVDVGALIQQPMDGFALGASGIGDFEWSNDALLCRILGLDLAAPYFNAGVLLLDLDAWRKEELTRRCIEFARDHAQQLATADQAILNFVFYRAFKALGPEFNQLLFPNVATVSAEHDRRRIFHFVGVPKPWDLLGRQLHGNYGLYEDVVRHTQMRHYRFHRNLTLTGLLRTLRNYRAYASLLRSR